MFTTRKATLEDLPQLSNLFDQYRSFYHKESDIEGAENFLKERLENQDSEIFVAEENGILTGFTQLYPLFSSTRMKRYWLLNDLFVNENHRGKGHSKALIEKAKGSKYMQSKPGDIYRKAYHWLMENPEKELLFVGMGCQSDGFRKFSEIKGIRDRVYIVDIICHGSPSPKLWREYAESIQEKDGEITYLTFKDKRNGWKSPTAYVKVNGAEKSIKDYVKVFYNRCALRPSCYECPYATTERKTDMTIGDFWHIEETIPDFYLQEMDSCIDLSG